MRTKFLLLGLLLMVSPNLFAQERYKVVYDFEKDTISYLQLKEETKTYEAINKPKFKRNSLVEIKLMNVNPFALKVNPNITQTDAFREGNNFNIGNLFTSINSIATRPSDLNLNINPPALGTVATDATTQNKIRGDADIMSNNIVVTNTLATDINMTKKFIVSTLVNPKLKKDEIQEKITNFLADVLQVDANIDESPEDNVIPFLIAVRQKVSAANKAVVDQATSLKRSYEDEAEKDEVIAKRENVSSISNSIVALDRLIAEANATKVLSLETLNVIQDLYSALESASFERTIDKEVQRDRMNINLQFMESDFYDSVGLERSNETLRERDIKVYAKGGLKINTSIALTLNNFGSNSKEYFLNSETNAIGADDNDYFVPSIATMVNFYPFMGEKFNVGGSFGLSIPITSDVTGVNFLLGPTFFFGSENRLAFSGGIAYGPTEELRNGAQVGDTFDGDSNQLTRDIYDFGYYFGISFSLFDVKN
ncbi:hypothetical protein [uncultured Psychroserpens sp.]|uniref:hypothetical protein n=1 Tax=uncultured Psychroserpens sp. TaxID=255436 RepID=UPI00261DDB06|nr:hypothetical protein [uncultured Psychroserpens sp.]